MTTLNDLPTWLLSQASHRAHDILVERLSEVSARGYDYRILDALSAATPCLRSLSDPSLGWIGATSPSRWQRSAMTD